MIGGRFVRIARNRRHQVASEWREWLHTRADRIWGYRIAVLGYRLDELKLGLCGLG